ncbi:tyrosine-type recombinase/integrase [Hungatella hathewayi]|uniref:tyrosine-type recombinase/integrase n=1 Tax=Hungatella hathewayi TaxID=154046 RepID=UPI00110AD5FE|nr:tyrosine-type recombinase/integrase [Hungatella hathewayi]
MRERKIMELTPEMLEPYREYLMDEERSRATVEKYLRDARKFLEYLGDDGRVDKEKVREFKQELMEHYKISSVNSMLAAVNSFLGFVGRGDLKVKLLKVQKAVYSRPEREMTEKEYEGLVRTAKRLGDLRMSMLLQTIGSTGIRISELKFITVESLETGRAEIYNKGKSRVVLLPVELTRLLKKYCRKAGIYAGSIFITRQGNPLDRSNVSKKMKQLGREAGVDVAKVFPHNLRHLFARVFYSIEKDVVRLMDLLGHSSISTTRIYTMSTEEQPRRQMSRMKLVLG